MFGTRISLPSPGMVLSSRSRYLEGRYYCFNLTDGLSSCKVPIGPDYLEPDDQVRDPAGMPRPISPAR